MFFFFKRKAENGVGGRDGGSDVSPSDVPVVDQGIERLLNGGK